MEYTYKNRNRKHICRICRKECRSGWKGEAFFYCDECHSNGDMEIEESILQRLRDIKKERKDIKEKRKVRLKNLQINRDIIQQKKRKKVQRACDVYDECYLEDEEDDEVLAINKIREENLMNYLELMHSFTSNGSD